MQRLATMLVLTLAVALLGFATSAVANPADTAERWVRVREADGIRVSRGVGKGSDTSRAEVELDANLFELLAALADAPRRVEWMSRCVEARQLSAFEDGSSLSYTRTQGIWPVADRDSVVRTRVTVAMDGASARIWLDASESPLAPVVDGVVRIPTLRGEYRLRATAPNRTWVDYRIAVDLGGRVPGFVQRFVRDEMPFDTVSGLRGHLARARGDYAGEALVLRERWPRSGSEATAR